MNRLTELERAVLLVIAGQEPALASALDKIRVSARENTGAGFYTTFAATSDPADNGLTSPVGDVGATVEGLKHGMGFLLWLANGRPRKLEGYSYGESTSDLDFEHVAFSEVSPRA